MRKFSGLQIAIGFGAALVAVLGLLFLAASTPDLPRAALEAKYATPPSQFLTLPDGTRVHYRVRGPDGAPAIVLLHGYMGSLFAWEKWSAILSDHFRVVSVDLPGNGLTGAVPSGDYSHGAMAQFVKAFADKLGLKRFAVAGNSMGGDVAAHFAELYPDRVSALVLVDAAGAQTETRQRRNLIGFVAGLPLTKSFAPSLPPCWLFPVGRHKAWNDCGNDPTWDFARLPGVRAAMLAHYRLPLDGYVWAHARDIKAPTLILWGQNDHTIPIASAYAWNKAIAGSKLITYPHAGHVSMLDVPEKSAADVRQFLSESR
ncbi:MAG TPA: alpha/beta hydrolase [Rhizomicrobium sp.]|nr:alpha/beta hydrolase [Rhizomicrobium sp.]